MYATVLGASLHLGARVDPRHALDSCVHSAFMTLQATDALVTVSPFILPVWWSGSALAEVAALSLYGVTIFMGSSELDPLRKYIGLPALISFAARGRRPAESQSGWPSATSSWRRATAARPSSVWRSGRRRQARPTS